MKINRLLKDQSGSILPITAAFVLVAVLLMSVVVDFGRYTVAKEKLQIATDSASLAAAKGADRMVRLQIDPGSQRECCGDGMGGCTPCCIDCGDPIIVEGKESVLLDSSGWRNYCCSCGCGPMQILSRWVNYRNSGSDAVVAASTMFDINKPAEMQASSGGSASLSVDPSMLNQANRGNPLYPSVKVQGQGKIKTLMLSIFRFFSPDVNTDEMDMSTCSQGRTYYRDLSTGKWIHPPNSNCSQ